MPVTLSAYLGMSFDGFIVGKAMEGRARREKCPLYTVEGAEELRFWASERSSKNVILTRSGFTRLHSKEPSQLTRRRIDKNPPSIDRESAAGGDQHNEPT
jgi:hypothetical protein